MTTDARTSNPSQPVTTSGPELIRELDALLARLAAKPKRAAAQLACGECGAPMHLRAGKYSRFYSCTRFPACRGAHGAHPDGSPKGVPGDQATRDHRIAAHAIFDRLWKSGEMRRKDAYRWMISALGITAAEAHIGQFDIARCNALIKAVAQRKVERGAS